MKIKKNIQYIYQNNVVKKNMLTYYYCGRKHICCYCLYTFITEEILEHHIKDSFKINGKKTIKMPKKGEYVKFKNFERKQESPFMIYTDFESIRVPENNGKQNSNES